MFTPCDEKSEVFLKAKAKDIKNYNRNRRSFMARLSTPISKGSQQIKPTPMRLELHLQPEKLHFQSSSNVGIRNRKNANDINLKLNYIKNGG